MNKRVSYSLLDPYIGPRIRWLYPRLRIPAWFPPEGIVITGHMMAIVGAVGFALSASHIGGGLLVALGVAGNHFADCIDGTHARATQQCRNGGELLDHFTDPLSFSYWIFGWSWAANRLELGIVGIIVLYATAVLTNIKAKMLGEFTLPTLGPTEFKTALALLGMGLSFSCAASQSTASALAFWSLLAATVGGTGMLMINLVSSIREVNASEAVVDVTEWHTVHEKRDSSGPRI